MKKILVVGPTFYKVCLDVQQFDQLGSNSGHAETSVTGASIDIATELSKLGCDVMLATSLNTPVSTAVTAIGWAKGFDTSYSYMEPYGLGLIVDHNVAGSEHRYIGQHPCMTQCIANLVSEWPEDVDLVIMLVMDVDLYEKALNESKYLIVSEEVWGEGDPYSEFIYICPESDIVSKAKELLK